MKSARRCPRLLVLALLSLALPGFAPAPAPKPSPSPSPDPVPTAARYLLIGDSHSDFYGNARGSFGFFGQRLQELIPSMSVYAVSGSTPSWWVNHTQAKWGCTVAVSGRSAGTCDNTPGLADIISGYDVVVFEQGANMQGMSRSKVQSQVKSVVQLIGNRKCYWVGAPNAPESIYSRSEQDALEANLKDSIAPCVFLSSREYPYEAGPNGDEHLSMRAAGAWAEGISAKFGR